MLRKILYIMVISLFFSCGNSRDPQSFSFLALNTTCSISIFSGPKVDESIVEGIIADIEGLMSTQIVGSDIARINRGEGVYADESTLQVVERGLYFSALSNGKFDISIGPLVKLWDVGNSSVIPSNADINDALALVDYRKIEVDSGGQVSLEDKEMSLDLGAIAKGYAADKVKEYLTSVGVESAIINLGGNINLIGSKIDGSDWRIGIQHPRENRGAYLGVVELKDTSLVSSGDYERFFEVNGERYHHILNSKTGYPVKGAFIATSIIYKNSMDSDALSTIAFSSSLEEIRTLSDDISFSGVFVTDDLTVYITEDLKDNFTLKDDRYRLITF